MHRVLLLENKRRGLRQECSFKIKDRPCLFRYRLPLALKPFLKRKIKYNKKPCKILQGFLLYLIFRFKKGLRASGKRYLKRQGLSFILNEHSCLNPRLLFSSNNTRCITAEFFLQIHKLVGGNNQGCKSFLCVVILL